MMCPICGSKKEESGTACICGYNFGSKKLDRPLDEIVVDYNYAACLFSGAWYKWKGLHTKGNMLIGFMCGLYLLAFVVAICIHAVTGSVVSGHGYIVFGAILTVILLVTCNYCGEYGETDYFGVKEQLNRKERILGKDSHSAGLVGMIMKVTAFTIVVIVNGLFLYLIGELASVI